jgi:hypothetical protein
MENKIMNYKQIIVVIIGVIAIIVTFLFPPWESYELVQKGQEQVLLGKLENRLFNNPPEHSDVKEPYIAWRYALQKAVVYVAVAGALCYFLRTKKSSIVDESPEKTSAGAAF